MTTLDMMKSQLESMVDQAGVDTVLELVATICEEKADHIVASYQDESLAKEWRRNGDRISRTAGSLQ